MLALAPLLAADIGGLIAIAFMVISFIGWLSNLISGQQKPGQRPQPPRPRPPQNKRLRDEIEAFMREAQGQGAGPPRAEPQPARAPAAENAAPAPRGPKPKGQRQLPAKGNQPKRPADTSAAARRAPGSDVSERRVESASLGASLQQHVSQHMAERVGAIASRDVEPTVDDAVAAHFAPFSGDQAAGALTSVERVRPEAGPAADLLKLLRNPQGVRQALVLGELLNPPVSMRRK
jgi:hypothetical protein